MPLTFDLPFEQLRAIREKIHVQPISIPSGTAAWQKCGRSIPKSN